MQLSLRTKLFLALLCVSLFAVLVTQGFVRWSFQRGLEQLAAERQAQRLDAIAERLVAIHSADGGWQRLAADRRLWVRTLLGAPERGWQRRRDGEPDDPGAPVHGPRSHGPPPWLHDALRGRFGGPGDPNAWPPARALERLAAGEPPHPLELRLMLLNAAGDSVYARPELLADAERLPLMDAGAQIGTLAVLPGPPVAELADLRFRERLRLALWLIALGVSLLAALLAFPLSKRLTRPVADFQRTMRRLAAGDYGARVAVQGQDELGRLALDLNALAAALAQTEQARRQWVADISHELRTPLALLRADIEAMQDGVRPLSPAALDALHADTLRLKRLIDDLYELSMTDLGALSYHREPLDLAALLAETLDGHREAFAGVRLGLELDVGHARDWTLFADPQRLAQLFRNLLQNSLAYTDAGGELRVGLARVDGRFCIDFHDSAPGVPAAALPHLFERLYRVDSSRNRATGGAGLGLAIARNIVLAHGGDIAAMPSPLGGLCVRIRLPPGGGAAAEARGGGADGTATHSAEIAGP
ncbi:ATP-binding protein [Thiohalocapsa sp. ML1]|jgi:two-component system, OmpR family, sensor histidine kinase BaeS|uniref:ATP-binding protein n=1 Tax=Thiohalocapsa sp. ML1 TaxID=1431688 RepID=UPI0009EB7A70|nr:ATP-binding protein [Thiohalocapsa sp. ML1]